MLRPIAVLLILACFALRMLACAEDVGIPASPISLVAISPGTFLMGSDISEERDSDEKPAHRVNISHAFYMGATEITQAQYTAVMTANPSYFKGDDLPVEQASWNDAVEFCRLLTEAERKKGNVPQGMEYRLPTEAEWEYCCRAGTTTDTFFGRDDWRTRDEYAWLGKNETHPVGKKKPNPWGLYDMYGNVWEWCHDWYGPYPQTANPAEAAIQSDPVGPAIGEFRVMRGIGWKYDYCGSTSRFKAAPTYRGSGMCGFRVVLAPPLVLPTGGKVTAGPLPLVFIKSGSFRMGSENGNPYEQPVFWAKMTKWFFIGATEVTQAQYRAVMGDNPSEFKGDDLPVESLRWDEAMEFCRLLTEQEHKKGNLSDGLVYRLPTEAEWEYSCRADAMGEYFFSQGMDGDAKLLGDYAWYEGNSEKKTHPVGTKKPNAWGLHDMHGNVWEWSLNWHSGSLKYGRDPIGWETGVDRSVRGGSWRNAAGGCRCAVRSAVLPYEKFNYLGFRVVVGRAIPQLLQQPIALVSIQPGTFMMGSEKGEPDEKPVHRVNITKGFKMGATEVSQAQYAAIMNANPSKYLSSDYPVSNVSWNDAVEFCRRLTESERKLGIIAPGLRYRLPTEAEWEYCCRAGSTTEYCFGDDPKGLYYYMLYSGSSLEQVGANKANAWGLSEMHGNVWEWCQDWYGPYSQDEQTDPTGPATGEFRTLRGGSSASGAYHCRSAFRGKVAPADRNDIAECGFRVVLAEEQAGK